MKNRIFLWMLSAFLLLSYSAMQAQQYTSETGIASYYGNEFKGRRTASGEKFDPDSLTCAHKTLPFGSLVKVTLLKTGDTVIVRVNDRGPWVRGRVIDISTRAAEIVGLKMMGLGKVKLDLVRWGPAPPAAEIQPQEFSLICVDGVSPGIPRAPFLLIPLRKNKPRDFFKPDTSAWDFPGRRKSP